MDFSQKANILRALCLISTTEASSGHPTSCLSAADLVTILFDKYFTYDINNKKELKFFYYYFNIIFNDKKKKYSL